MAYEIPYDSDYEYWYGIPQDVTRLSAVLEQTIDEDEEPIGIINASWDMPDNGGTFVALLSTDGENFTIAENNIRQNSVILVVEPSTDYYLKIITVLGGNQSDGTVSSLLSTDIPTPSTPDVTVTMGGLRIDVGIIPLGYTASILVDDGENVAELETNEPEYMYLCSEGEYSVSVAYMDTNGNIGSYSSAVTVTLDNNVYNLKTPLITSYIIADDGGDYYTDTAGKVILQSNAQTFKKYNNLPAIGGVFHRNLYRTPLLVSTVADAVKIQMGNNTPWNAQGSFEDEDGVVWYYCSYDGSNDRWDNSYVAQNFPEVNNGTRYENNNIVGASKKLLEEANPTLFPTESIEENLFYPTDVTLSSGDTITDTNLKSLVAYHRPISINGTIYTPSDYTNGTYTYYALKNGTSSAEIGKVQIDSSWAITITTESGGGGGGYVLPIASASTLGGVKVGNNLSIDENGVLSASGGGGGGDVTTNTDQNITGTKTFVGQKKILFKQSANTDKLGFTLYTNDSKEKGFLEYNPQNLIDNVPLFTIGNHADSSDNLAHIGFRKLSRVSGASGAYNLLTPLIADARSPFNLTTSSYTNFYFPLGVTDGTTMVKTDKRGVLDISSLLSATIPIASSSTLGGIKVGTNLSIDANGVLSATDTTYSVFVGSGASASSGLVPAPPTTAGTSKYLREDGSWSVPSGGGGGGGSYSAGDGIDITNDVISLEKASANGLGGIKVGSGLSIDNNGVLSATGGGGGGSFTQNLLYSGNWTSGNIILSDSIQNYDDFVVIINNSANTEFAWAVTNIVIKDVLINTTSTSPIAIYGEASRKFCFYYVDDTHLGFESRSTYAVRRIYGRKY